MNKLAASSIDQTDDHRRAKRVPVWWCTMTRTASRLGLFGLCAVSPTFDAPHQRSFDACRRANRGLRRAFSCRVHLRDASRPAGAAFHAPLRPDCPFSIARGGQRIRRTHDQRRHTLADSFGEKWRLSEVLQRLAEPVAQTPPTTSPRDRSAGITANPALPSGEDHRGIALRPSILALQTMICAARRAQGMRSKPATEVTESIPIVTLRAAIQILRPAESIVRFGLLTTVYRRLLVSARNIRSGPARPLKNRSERICHYPGKSAKPAVLHAAQCASD